MLISFVYPADGMFMLFKVTAIIRLIDPSLPTSIKYVRQYKARKVVYDIEMYTVADSQAIRDAYGLFYRKKSGKRLPGGLKKISLSNVTTYSTRVRVRLLKEICHRHQAANPSISCFVTGYLPRPELKIRDRKGPLLSFTYTEAVQQLSHHLTADFLKDLYHFARTNLPEKEVKDRFLLLGSDLLCTASADLMSMSVDEVNQPIAPVAIAASSPLISALPAPLPAPLAAPLSDPLALPSNLTAPSAPNIPETTSQPVLTSPAPGTSHGGDEFTLVDRRGRTRFSRGAAPY